MKTLFYPPPSNFSFQSLILAMFFMLLLSSCNKEPEALVIRANSSFEEPQDQVKQSGPHEMKFEKINISTITNNFSSQMATFRDEKEFQTFIHNYNELSEEQQESVVSRLQYSTLKKKIDKAYLEMISYREESQFYNKINELDGLLSIEFNEDGEKEVFEPLVSRHSVLPFLNEDMLIKVGPSYFKYVGKYAFISDNSSSLRKIMTLEDALAKSIEHQLVVESISVSQSEIDMRQDVNTPFSFFKTINKPYCNSDRRARLTVLLDVDVNSTFREYFREAEFTALRKGFPCIWYKYNTQMSWDNFDMVYDNATTVPGDPTLTVNWTESSWSCSSCKEKVFRESIGTIVNPYEMILDWVKVESDLNTTGVGDFNVNSHF